MGPLGILAYICWIGSLVCWIIVLVKIFQDSIGLGILGILCGLFAFIYGWVKVGEDGIKKVMIVWTVLWLASIPLYALAAAGAAAAIQAQ